MDNNSTKTIAWRVVPKFEDYEISEYGDLRRGTKHLKPERVQGSGRKRFRLSVGGRLYTLKAAQIVALAFIGPKPFDGAEVCHKDGFFHNNHYSNLRWDTRQGNAADSCRHAISKGRSKREFRVAFLATVASQILAAGSRRRAP